MTTTSSLFIQSCPEHPILAPKHFSTVWVKDIYLQNTLDHTLPGRICFKIQVQAKCSFSKTLQISQVASVKGFGSKLYFLLLICLENRMLILHIIGYWNWSMLFSDSSPMHFSPKIINNCLCVLDLRFAGKQGFVI